MHITKQKVEANELMLVRRVAFIGREAGPVYGVIAAAAAAAAARRAMCTGSRAARASVANTAPRRL